MSGAPQAGTGLVLMVVAPSGAGKSSLVKALLAQDPDIALSVSHTTRPPRPGELEGREYHFLDAAQFERRQAAGEYLETALVHGNRYGTSRAQIAERILRGQDILLEIDWQGALQVRGVFPAAVGVFLLPPSFAALEQRLHGRGQDSAEVIARRLANARDEMAHALDFDYVLVNDVFEQTLAQMRAIVQAARLRTPLQAVRQAALLRDLLAL